VHERHPYREKDIFQLGLERHDRMFMLRSCAVKP
jgi:hypothetical protein